MPANLENSAVAAGLEKVSFIPIPKKSNAKECSNYSTIALILNASKIMLKILQARLQQLQHVGSVVVAPGLWSTGSAVVALRLGCFLACGIVLD